jgi:hypothetical protein
MTTRAWLAALLLTGLLAPTALAEPTRDFTIAIFGDTQKMVRAVAGPPFTFPGAERDRMRRFSAMVDWVIDHRKAEHIELVLHVGDAINAGIEPGPESERSAEEWRRFDSQWKRLDRAVPYLIARGNHDDPTGFARYYGKARYQKLAERFPALAHLGSTAADDGHALRLDLGGQPTLLLSVSCNPPPEELAFVHSQLEQNAELPAILVSHIITAGPGIHVRSTSSSNPWCSRNPPGADLWSEVVLAHPGQVVLAASGHVVQSGLAQNASKTIEELEGGARVLDTYQNFQAFSDTPAGYYLTLVRVRPGPGTVEIETLSPVAREGDPEFPRRLVVEGRTHLAPTPFRFSRKLPPG